MKLLRKYLKSCKKCELARERALMSMYPALPMEIMNDELVNIAKIAKLAEGKRFNLEAFIIRTHYNRMMGR